MAVAHEVLTQCQSCGTLARAGARFCDSCGGALSDAARILAESTVPPTASARGERRHLTVLFCDLVGSTSIAAKLDPEEWRELAAAYHRTSARAVERFGGSVAKYLGDGIMAYFGWPEAHGDDPERAVRAGLAILEAISKLNEQLTDIKLSARVGIDSGIVVVGTGASNELEVFGETPNIAARVQAAAARDMVLITEATHRLVSGLFVVEQRGAHTLKGIEWPLQLYHVVQPSGVRGRLEALAATHGLTPFMGRENELRLLSDHWQRVRDGEGHVALITGDPGIGKSRLIHRFHEQIADTPHTWIEVTATPFFQNTPLYPVSENLLRALSRRGDESLEEQLAQLESALVLAGLDPSEAIPLIAPLVNMELPAKYPRSALSAEHQRQRLLALMVEWVVGLARVQPTVMVTEDLHWADPSTLELIQMLVEQGPTPQLLLLCTARPEFRAPWTPKWHHTRVNLNNLSLRDARIIVEQLVAQKGLSEETIEAVVERTGGVPLFVEELTRAVLESGDIMKRVIPVSLNDSLMARLDRLGPAKEVAQLGAVIGNEFSYELIQAVHPIPEQDLQRALGILTAADLLYAYGAAPHATYLFKHALIRDAAYEALLKSQRKDLHSLIAQTISEQFPALKEEHPEVLAHHWMEAGKAEPALAAWQKAAERALERRAYREAEQHYRNALAVLQTIPEARERDQRELSLQVALGGVMTVTRGWSAGDTANAYGRARVVAERANGAKSVQLLFGLYNAALTRGEHGPALSLASQLLDIVHDRRSPSALAIAHYAQAMPRHYIGDLVNASHHFHRAIEHHRRGDFAGLPFADPILSALIITGANEWLLGYPERALHFVDDALAPARRLMNPSIAAFALSTSSYVYELRRDYKRTLEVSDEGIRLAAAAKLPLLNALGTIYNAWAQAQRGGEGAADRIREALAQFDAMNFYLGRSGFLGLLCEAQVLTGALGDAFGTIDQALQTSPDEVIFRPNLLRMRGHLRLQSDSESAAHRKQAERDFREAVELAHRIGAKSLELRASTSLARLLVNEGHREQACAILTDIYHSFTEGFDTPDLIEAKTLLEILQT
jgi:class 3 adenylate cyclase/tetratricopeptide (TPR) repeat protein